MVGRRHALKLIGGLGAAGFAAPLLTACGESEDPGAGVNLPPIKIGVLLPLTGVLKSDGDDLGNGFRLYVKLNGNKMGGRPADVAYVDEGQSPDSGKAGLETLLQKEKAQILAGVISSGVMTAIRERVESAQIPLVGSNGSPTTVEGSKWIWRTSWAARDPGKALGKYVAQNAGGSVAVMAADYAAGRDFVGGFLETFQPAGGKIEGTPYFTQYVPTPSSDFRVQLAAIKQSPAKAVFCFYAGALAVNFIKQYRQLGLTQTLYAVGSLTEGGTLKAAGPEAQGIYTAFNYSPDLDIPANRAFAAAYSREYARTPSTYAVAAFDAAAVIDRAIALAGRSANPQTLNSAIARIGQIRSPRGNWEFTENQTPVQRWYLRRVGMDGTGLANVVISELATM
jgi:branched-chain amino acid transport system substrate-binding protein